MQSLLSVPKQLNGVASTPTACMLSFRRKNGQKEHMLAAAAKLSSTEHQSILPKYVVLHHSFFHHRLVVAISVLPAC